MSWAGQQDKVPSPHPEERSGTVCLQPLRAEVWDGVTEHPNFKTPNTSRIRISLNHTPLPPSPAGHSHIPVPSWCDPCTSQEVAWQSSRAIAATASLLGPLTLPSFNLLSPKPRHPTSSWSTLPPGITAQPLHPAHTAPASYIHMPPPPSTTKGHPLALGRGTTTSLALALQPKSTPFLHSN